MPPKNSKHLLCISYFKFKYEHKNKNCNTYYKTRPKYFTLTIPCKQRKRLPLSMILLFSLPLHAQIKKPIHTYNSDLLTDHNKNMPIYNKYKKISLKEW